MNAAITEQQLLDVMEQILVSECELHILTDSGMSGHIEDTGNGFLTDDNYSFSDPKKAIKHLVTGIDPIVKIGMGEDDLESVEETLWRIGIY